MTSQVARDIKYIKLHLFIHGRIRKRNICFQMHSSQHSVCACLSADPNIHPLFFSLVLITYEIIHSCIVNKFGTPL